MTVRDRIEERRDDIQEKKRKAALAELDAAVDDVAADRLGDAVVRLVRVWYRMPGPNPNIVQGKYSELISELDNDEEIIDGLSILKDWWINTLRLADRPMSKGVDEDAIHVAFQNVRGHLGDYLLDEAVWHWNTDRQNVMQALAAVEFWMQAIGWVEDDGEDVYVLGEDFEESPLQSLAERRRRQDRDLKVIIVARDSQTGTGKTTLAVQLCQLWSDEWTADLAANTASDYMETFEDAPRESVILADEIGTMFDNRRSMSGDNVDASQMWDIMRKWEKWTIATLPGASSLDKRFLQKADVLIVVRERGVGRVLELKETDVEGDLYTQGMCTVRWGAIDDDPEYQRVEAMKDELMERKIGEFLGDDRGDEDADQGDELDEDEARRVGRNETIRQLVEAGVTQTDIADALGVSQSTVSRIVRED